MRTAIAAYGGYALQDVTTPKDPKSAVSSTPAHPPVTNAPTPATGTAATAYRFSGMPSQIKNAVRMVQPFNSKNSTVDKARAFWDAFERATVGLDESLRLSAFRECLKGKPGEEWWMDSKIEDFETLRVRFHNQFICLTPLQMIERLKNTKRSRGMSAEVWGDIIQGLCDRRTLGSVVIGAVAGPAGPGPSRTAALTVVTTTVPIPALRRFSLGPNMTTHLAVLASSVCAPAVN
ncbi:hypothetical protein PF010_g18874 [Phytophthora fragariae]|uniref:Retrotransposon gag domain-containing protein n=1 Tax=Phytophthora fragariae TaxID=53985 RepID=A0A6A3XBA5_9STRA|nr:hypothetical protein PF011_g17690 [Phytophthora fragariae]KAE9089721.1 hypothetical protein PF010_g18874 [Phytophthora fragariae]KAE9199657.1 hypothetical protein PF002_g22082 [Phytophthora fragariae]KAE9203913.1 hypothetical protein PF004_g17993 [Phytophthora fragariae]